MITFLVAVVLLVWAVRFAGLSSWGWWLGLIVLAFFLDKILEGLAHLAPRPPRVYGATDSHVVQEAEERLAALRESTRRTIEYSDKIAAEVAEDRRRRQAEGGGL